MSKRILILLLVALVGLSIFLVYGELQALPVTCVNAEFWCENQCWGDFSLDYCWEDDGREYCWFYCDSFGRSCGWNDPTYAICEGGAK